jgi:hypothetical protein
MLRRVAVLGSFVLGVWCAVAMAQTQNASVPTMVPSTGAATVPVEPMVDNPHYLAWSKFKPGTRVDLDMNIAVGGQKMVTNVAMTLSDVSAEKAVVDSIAKITVPGFPAAGVREEKQTRTFAAKVPQSEAERAFLPPNAIGQSKETGAETISAGGKEYRCTIREFDGTIQGQPAKGTMWRNDQIPGGLVKMEASGSPNMTVTMELKSVSQK